MVGILNGNIYFTRVQKLNAFNSLAQFNGKLEKEKSCYFDTIKD